VQALIHKLSKLNQASQAMTRCRELAPLLDTILSLVEDVFDIDTCAVLLIDEEGGHLRVERARGYDPGVTSSFRCKLGEGITGQVAREGKPVFVQDVQKRTDYVGGVRGAVCEIAAPMRIDDVVIGVLDAESRKRVELDATDLEVFAAFADHAAVAVQNARLHDSLARRTAQLEQQVHRMELLGAAAEAMSSTLDQDQLLHRVLALSKKALRFENCAVLLFNGTEGFLKVRAAIGYDDAVKNLEIPIGQGVTGEVARTGRPLLVADVDRSERYIRGVIGGRCEMAAPLIANDVTLGVLDAESPIPGVFTNADLELFSTFALHAAAALANAETYRALEEANVKLHRNVIEIERMNRELLEHARVISETNAKLEHRVNELLTLQEASKTITSSLDLDDTLDAIVGMTRSIVHCSMSAIKLVDEETNEVRVRGQLDEGKENGAMLGVPLRIGERTIGSFEVSRGDESGFSDEERRLIETLASQAAIAIENARLFENTQRTYFETIRSLAQALEARDSYTKGHSERVMRYAVQTAEAMGIAEEERRLICHAALLHDIGKIGIADAVLNKGGLLSKEDRDAIEHHPIWGDSIIGPIRMLDRVQTLVRHHHERFDGKGYPDKLVGTDIPLGARIIAVADAFDAMTSNRPYRDALPLMAAVKEMQRGAGTQFDPEVVEVFLQVLASTGIAQATGEAFEAALEPPTSVRRASH
jgi:GAF domain-containing protein